VCLGFDRRESEADFRAWEAMTFPRDSARVFPLAQHFQSGGAKKGFAMKFAWKITPVLLFLIATAYAQEIHYNYDRGTNFAAYKTYQWVNLKDGGAPDQLLDQNIKRAIDEQLTLKGLTRVNDGADLFIAYQAAVSEEKSVNLWGTGPRWYGGGMVQGETSTISVGKLVVDMYDPGRKQLIWRGEATKTLDPSKDPDKNYRRLQKAMAKLFKNYPPAPKN
jgi:hypothetical protein